MSDPALSSRLEFAIRAAGLKPAARMLVQHVRQARPDIT
jgi:hypothetical protein